MESNLKELSKEELDHARKWWDRLPSMYKGRCSIWTLLALYGRYILETQTVAFDAGKPGARK
jgi:hypothetical protein